MSAESKAKPELSPAVARRVQLGLELEKALAIHTPEVVAAHEKLVVAVLGPGERAPDVAASLDFYRRVMVLVRTNMVAADLAYLAGLEREAELCAERDLVIVSVTKKTSRARRACSGFFGRGALGALGLAGPMPKGRSAIRDYAHEAANRLRSYSPAADRREDGASPGDVSEVELWLASVARSLEDDLEALKRIVGVLDKEREESEKRLERRKETIAEFDDQYLPIGKLAEGALRLAGKTEEADRIRPSVRQLYRKGEGEGEEG